MLRTNVLALEQPANEYSPIEERNEVYNINGYWTLSARSDSGMDDSVWMVRCDSSLEYDDGVDYNYAWGGVIGVRPVINLKI